MEPQNVESQLDQVKLAILQLVIVPKLIERDGVESHGMASRSRSGYRGAAAKVSPYPPGWAAVQSAKLPTRGLPSCISTIHS